MMGWAPSLAQAASSLHSLYVAWLSGGVTKHHLANYADDLEFKLFFASSVGSGFGCPRRSALCDSVSFAVYPARPVVPVSFPRIYAAPVTPPAMSSDVSSSRAVFLEKSPLRGISWDSERGSKTAKVRSQDGLPGSEIPSRSFPGREMPSWSQPGSEIPSPTSGFRLDSKADGSGSWVTGYALGKIEDQVIDGPIALCQTFARAAGSDGTEGRWPWPGVLVDSRW